MEETTSLLLPLLLLAMSVGAVLPGDSRSDILRVRRILAGSVLLLSALVAFVTGPLEFHGPTLFALDSFHQVEFTLQAGWLPLGLLAVFVWISLCDSRTNYLLAIATALFLLADNFGLQLLAGAWLFGLLVVERYHKREAVGIETSLGLFALMFLILFLGLLVFDVDADSWSGLTSALKMNDDWSAHDLSSLKLASYFLIFSALILVGLAPLQAFWISADRREQNIYARETVRFLLAIGLLHRSRELLIWSSTSQFAISLAFVTFLMTAFCAPFQLGPQRVVRTLVASHFALAMTGLLGPDDMDFAVGICHAIVACGMFVLLSEDGLLRERFTPVMTLLIPFSGCSGVFLLVNSSTESGIGIELAGLLVWMTLGLTQTQSIRHRRRIAIDRSGRAALIPAVVILGITPVVLWGYFFKQYGLASTFERIWLIPGVILAGVTGIAIGWYAGCSRPAGEWLGERIPGVARIFARQFYLREFVEGTIRVPGAICLGVFEWIREGMVRAIRLWEDFLSRRHKSHDESVRWELLRGLVCAAVLMIVFLWMGR